MIALYVNLIVNHASQAKRLNKHQMGGSFMAHAKYFLVGMILILMAGCKSTDKDKVEQPAQTQPPAQENVQPPAVQVETPAPTAPEPVQTAKLASTPRPKAKPTPAPAASTAPATPGAAPVAPQPAVAPPLGEVATPQAQAAAPAAPAVPQPRLVTIPSGTSLQVRLEQALDSGVNRTGDTFRAVVDQDVVIDGKAVVPRGSIVEGRLIKVERSGRVEGRAAMSLELTNLQLENENYPLQTNVLALEAESTKKSDATKVGIGAGLGAVIGAIAGGGKGAAIGAAAGAGAGGATVLATRGKEIKLDVEQKLKFELRRDLTVRLK